MRPISRQIGLSLLLFSAMACPAEAWAQLFCEPGNDAVIAAEGPGGFPVRYTIRRDFGQGIGYDEGYVQLGMFAPLCEPGGTSLLFFDLQPLVDDDGNFGGNAGLGYRWYSPLLERAFGVYGYLDYRESDRNEFKQGSIGLDSLGKWVDVRANLYLPDEEKQALPNVARFIGFHLAQGYEAAMSGGNAELGLVLPEIFGTQTRLLGGFYQFETEEATEAAGARFRIESHWTSNISTDVAFSDDDYFGTTVTVSLAINWQPESYSNRMPQIQSFRRGTRRHITEQASDRLAEPTHRLNMIAVRQGAELARTPSGELLRLFHVDSAAAPGGDGRFGSPFQTLEEALSQAEAQGVETVYTPFGGDYNPSGFLDIPQDVRLLSNAPVQTIQTAIGGVILPGSGASPDLSQAPQISSSVRLADGSTLNGFRIEGTAAITGEEGTVLIDGASGFTVANNAISSLTDGIRVSGGSAGLISGNVITAPALNGIVLEGGSDLDVFDNQITAAGEVGIRASDVADLILEANRVSDAASHGILVQGGSSPQILNNDVIDSGGAGIRVENGTGTLLSGNVIDGAAGNGIDITGTAFSGTIFNNEISDSLTGISAVVANTFQAQLSQNLLFANREQGMLVDAGRITSTSIFNNDFVENAEEGLAVIARGTPASNLSVLNNLFEDNNVVGGAARREFFARLEGTGPMTVQLGGNSSANVVPLGQFNYDFSDTIPGAAGLTYTLPTANVGTVGSSNNSVPAPITTP